MAYSPSRRLLPRGACLCSLVRTYWSVVLILLMGLAAALLMLASMDAWLHGRMQELLEQRARAVVADANDRLRDAIRGLQAVQDSLNYAGRFDRPAFRLLAEGVARRTHGTIAISWAARVRRDERAAFERAAEAAGLAGFRITELDAAGQIVPAADRDEYIVVAEIAPRTGLERAFGLDIAAEPMQRAALDAARDTAALVATGGLHIVQNVEASYGFLVVAPVYRTLTPPPTVGQRRDDLLGFTVGVFRMEDMVAAALEGMPTAYFQVQITDRATTDPAQQQLYPAAVAAAAVGPGSWPRHHTAAVLEVAGHQWQLDFVATEASIAELTWQQRWVAFALGVLATALLTSLRYTGIWQQQRRRAAEAALRASEERFRGLIEHSADGLVLLSEQGIITYRGPATTHILGYCPDENLGKSVFTLVHPDDREQVEQAFARLVARPGETVTQEMRGLHQRGEWVYLEATGTNLLHEPAVNAVVVNFRDITERRRMQQQLEDLALYDALTGLPNRQLLRDRLHQALLATERQRATGALLLLNLDRFREINEAFGYPAGDAVLQEVAARFSRVLRATDTVARLGGDEFAFVVPAVGDRNGAAALAERLLSVFGLPLEIEGTRVALSGSIGVALFPDHGMRVDDLLRRADVAMYAAKRAQTGYTIFAPEQETSSIEQLVLITELRQAIEQDDLVLYYQPQVSLPTGVTVGAEALVRWPHPQRGLVPPEVFVPLAERTGLVRLLTHKVLEQAVAQLGRWEQAGLGLVLSVNLSARDFEDTGLPDHVERLLLDHRVPPIHLQLEIVESTLMADPASALALVQRFRALGVSVSIDDFGTGYSSLAYLQQLPVHEVKIDRSFVMGMLDNPGAAAIVRTVIELGHNLGLRVVAEGVERREMADALRGLGCDVAQGYYFCRPLPAAAFEQWLRAPGMPQR